MQKQTRTGLELAGVDLEWKELSDEEQAVVVGGNFTTDLVNQAKSISNDYSALGKALGNYFTSEFSYNG